MATPSTSMRPLQPRGGQDFVDDGVIKASQPLHRPNDSSSSSSTTTTTTTTTTTAKATATNSSTYSAPGIGMKRKATTACRNCQKKRTRCSAGWPCVNCARSDLECHYAPLADRRRKDFANTVSTEEMAALQQRMAEQEASVHFYRRAWTCLEGPDETRAAALLSLIRKKAPRADVKDFLDRSASPKSQSVERHRSTSVSRSTPPAAALPLPRAKTQFSLRALCDEPVVNVPAYPWTTVTSDDAFVSHLVSLWFTWSQPYMSWIHRDLFVRDMRSGNLQSPFCSRFLVNAICAQACAWSDYPEANAQSGDKSTSGLHFHEQAHREYELLEGKTDVTVVQGLTVFAIATMLQGKDRRGWQWLQAAVAQAKELRSMPEHQHPFISPADAENLSLVLDRAEWGLYTFVACSSLSLQTEALMTQPRRRRPPMDHEHDTGLRWLPYPHPAPEASIHEGCYLNSQCDLLVIAEKINRVLFPGDTEPRHPPAVRKQLLEGHMEELLAWKNTTPPCLDVRKFNVPSLLTLRMVYEGIVIVTATALRAANPSPSATASAATAASLASALELARLFDVFTAAWGAERTPVCFMHWAALAMLTLLERLADDPRASAAFAGVARALHAACRRWVLAKGMMRLVQLRARALGVCERMPREAARLFAEFEAKEWREERADEGYGVYPEFLADAMQLGGDRGRRELLGEDGAG